MFTATSDRMDGTSASRARFSQPVAECGKLSFAPCANAAAAIRIAHEKNVQNVSTSGGSLPMRWMFTVTMYSA